jgi:nitrogen fixation protein FixH
MTASQFKSTRSLWPLAIAGYFIIAVLGIIVFITWAVRQNQDLVRKDYYAEEIQYQGHLDQLNRARQLDWKPKVAYDRVRDVVVVSLTRHASSVSGQVQFYRPSDAALDKRVKLSLNGEGSQQIDARAFRGGLWKIRIIWTSDAKKFFSEETVIIDRT